LHLILSDVRLYMCQKLQNSEVVVRGPLVELAWNGPSVIICVLTCNTQFA